MSFDIPDPRKSMIVASPHKYLPHITQNKRYIISEVEEDYVWIVNDYGQKSPYKAIHFMEVDVLFSLSLYITFMRLLNLSSKPLI